ncbi:putative FBD domain, leucine-rich repeat domain superfamily [Helianthus annuus]|nr:putative FBD domain, leucine-rich repeat domain superfamily [Helianthus annuus]
MSSCLRWMQITPFFQINQTILHLARNHTVKKLTLDFSQSTTHGLPLCVFLLHHLTDLYLKNCDINHKPIISGFGPFSSITSLSLKLSGCRRISRETLLHVLTTCPSLKRLCLLVYEGSFRGYEKPNIVHLFKCLPVIEHLTISGHILSLLVKASVPEKPPPSLVHLKYLCIKELNFADDYGLTFLAVLIKCSPNLEKIKLVSDAIDHDEEGESVKLREYSYIQLEHLNELEIKFFSNKKHEMELVKFILARSPSLKKVRLLTAMICKNEALEVLEILLRSPRASPIEIVAENLCHYQFYYY